MTPKGTLTLFIQAVGFDNQAIQSVAYTDPACLCIGNDRWTYAYIAIAVEERMAYAGTWLYNRYCGILAYEVYQAAAAARNYQIYIIVGMQ